MSECYLETKYGIKHDKIPELYTRQYYSVGKLFHGRKICAWCLIKLQDAIKVLDIALAQRQHFIDVGSTDPEVWRKRNPVYAQVVDDIGVATLKFELTKNLFEHPFEPVLIETPMPRIRVEAEDGGSSGYLPSPPKEPTITVD